jgi:hypothetical protein
MGLRENLRSIGPAGTSSVRPALDREWADIERRIRRKMRIYPERCSQSAQVEADGVQAAMSAIRLPVGGRAAEQLTDPECPPVRRAIISIHGRDLVLECDEEDNECGHLMQSW